MHKLILSALALVLILAFAACGASDAPAPTAAPATSAPATEAAEPTDTPEPATQGMTEATSLDEYAAKFEGGPGAIYVGDLNQLVGPAPSIDQGDFDGNVPLDALERHEWIYTSEFYQSLLEKAKLLNPTELVYDGDPVEIQHACINRALLPCALIETYLAPNLEKRTNGKLVLNVSSYPELGLAGPDTLTLVSDGTLEMANIYGGYVGGEMPPIEIQNLWGIYPDRKTEFEATIAITPDLEALVRDATGGFVLNHNWFSGNDLYFFSKEPLATLEDFNGLKTRSHSAALSDWIEGIGGDAQFLAFAEVYTALERGILEAAVAGADAGHGQRWYEVTDYLAGPLTSFPSTNNIINGDKWASIPPNLQQILIEEGAKSELEALRIASIQNEMGLAKNLDKGMTLDEFNEEVNERSLNSSVIEYVIPAWINRVGSTDHEIIGVFNEKVSPLVGLTINADGSVTKTEVQK